MLQCERRYLLEAHSRALETRDREIFVSSSIVTVLRKVTKYPPEFIHLCE